MIENQPPELRKCTYCKATKFQKIEVVTVEIDADGKQTIKPERTELLCVMCRSVEAL